MSRDTDHQPVRPTATPQALGYRFPAEWERQRATWFAWPHNESDWPGKFEPIEWVFCEMIAAVCRSQRAGVMVSPALRARAEQRLRVSGVDLARVDWLEAVTDRSWTRDTFPTFVVGPPEDRKVGAVKWQFNAWARYPEHAQDEAAGMLAADRVADALWLPQSAAGGRFVLEGGAIDSDGQGTLLTTTQCLLGTEFPRNPGLTQLQIERVLSDYLSVDRILWIPGGIAGDDTSGHVDDLARFVAPGRVVLAQEQSPFDENYRPLQRAREALEGQRDARGRTLEVVPLPMPRARAFDGQRIPASYANFLICNEAVLVPTFNDPADRHALGLLAELFPQREVVGIHAADLVLGLGALHCSSHEEPAA